jgi:predicted outer membrane lipoprotein
VVKQGIFHDDAFIACAQGIIEIILEHVEQGDEESDADIEQGVGNFSIPVLISEIEINGQKKAKAIQEKIFPIEDLSHNIHKKCLRVRRFVKREGPFLILYYSMNRENPQEFQALLLRLK